MQNTYDVLPPSEQFANDERHIHTSRNKRCAHTILALVVNDVEITACKVSEVFQIMHNIHYSVRVV